MKDRLNLVHFCNSSKWKIFLVKEALGVLCSIHGMRKVSISTWAASQVSILGSLMGFVLGGHLFALE